MIQPLNELTPVEYYDGIWVKRDDLFEIAGVRGGKVRTAYKLSRQAFENGKKVLVTVGSRLSPQIEIVAHIAKHFGMHCRAHTTLGEFSSELKLASSMGAEIIQHHMGFNNVLSARATEDVENDPTAALIPFGMRSQEAIQQTRRQIANIPKDCKRIVVPVGSGMSLNGILWGLLDANINLPVLGVLIGGKITSTMHKYGPPLWPTMVKFIDDGLPYKQLVDAYIGTVQLDPIYEAKAAKFAKPGDLFWCVGVRKSRMNWSKNDKETDTTSSIKGISQSYQRTKGR
jgi:hypothetical protein